MSSTRGRVERVGGIAVDAGASGRTDASQLTRPAYKMQASFTRPLGKTAVGGIALHPLFDFQSASFWRFFWAAAAAAYVIGFHLRLGRVRVGIGPR